MTRRNRSLSVLFPRREYDVGGGEYSARVVRRGGALLTTTQAENEMTQSSTAVQMLPRLRLPIFGVRPTRNQRPNTRNFLERGIVALYLRGEKQLRRRLFRFRGS